MTTAIISCECGGWSCESCNPDDFPEEQHKILEPKNSWGPVIEYAVMEPESDSETVNEIEPWSFEEIIDQWVQVSKKTKPKSVPVDRYIKCIGCEDHFLFIVTQQEFFKLNNYNDPKRCRACKKIQKSNQ